jgi:hypothetical protein
MPIKPIPTIPITAAMQARLSPKIGSPHPIKKAAIKQTDTPNTSIACRHHLIESCFFIIPILRYSFLIFHKLEKNISNYGLILHSPQSSAQEITIFALHNDFLGLFGEYVEKNQEGETRIARRSRVM